MKTANNIEEGISNMVLAVLERVRNSYVILSFYSFSLFLELNKLEGFMIFVYSV